MAYKMLFIFVEGIDDQRFFEKIIIPRFKKDYDDIKIVQYSHWAKKKIKAFIKSISSMKADYLYFTDINNNPCVTAKKGKVKKTISLINDNKLIVVVREIESWYLAGVFKRDLSKFKIRSNIRTTDDLSKEKFNELIPRNIDSRINFMIDLL